MHTKSTRQAHQHSRVASSWHQLVVDTDKVLTCSDARHEPAACAARHGQHFNGQSWDPKLNYQS